MENLNFGSENDKLVAKCAKLFASLESLDTDSKVKTINAIKLELHAHSPMAREPVDCVTWVLSDEVHSNDYNPNSVAPPEMKLLAHSILEDGYTQPIVAFRNGNGYEVVDGFHRNRVGKENKKVKSRVHGYLPLTVINPERTDKSDRMASTIRHNRARGKHKVEGMSDIVIELKRRNWSDDRICRELGMEQDEVLRLCQITGLAELFTDQEFSKSWDIEGEVNESDFKELSDDATTYGEETDKFRSVNTDDPNRIFHTYDKWECYKAGFYATCKEGMTKDECEEAYRLFFLEPDKFKNALEKVIIEWKHSCEHYLTNSAMNRIAWLGQAAVCYALKIPSTFRSGFSLLTQQQQQAANIVALIYLNKWLVSNNRPEISMEEALSHGRQSDIY